MEFHISGAEETGEAAPVSGGYGDAGGRRIRCCCLDGLHLLENAQKRGIRRLTGREREVLNSLTSCDNNRLIARRLGITERTVKAHLTSILAKLGLSSRTEAAMVALIHHPEICPAGTARPVQRSNGIRSGLVE